MSFILCVTGPAGAGKTTVTGLVAHQLERSVCIEVDAVKEFIISDFADYETSLGNQKWQLLGDNIGVLAKNYQVAGYNVIIDGYLKLSSWKRLLKHVDVDYKFLMLPSLEVNIQRNNLRSGNKKLLSQTIQRHHAFYSHDKYFEKFIKLDSSTDSASETASKILAYLHKQL